MKAAFVIHTPAQAHLWHYPILRLKEKGHSVLVIAREDGYTSGLLASHGIPFSGYGKAGKTSQQKLARLPLNFWKAFNIMRRFKPDIIAGTGLIEAYSAFFLRKPCIIFDDTEITPALERVQWQRLASLIITPDCYKRDLGKKHLRFAGYKELAYLTPEYFKPDPSIYSDLGIRAGEKYAVLRFNAINALHDTESQISGLSDRDKYELIRIIEKHARVFISIEGAAPDDMKKYILPAPYQKIHQVLYYACLYAGDGGTMATESAILGTPVVHFERRKLGSTELNSTQTYGNFDDLANKFHLIHTFNDTQNMFSRALELVQDEKAKANQLRLKELMLKDKIDVVDFLVSLIEDYPENPKKYKRG